MTTSTTKIQKVFASLQKEYGVNSDIELYEQNFDNHLAGVKEVISRIDSDVRENFEKICFTNKGSPTAFCKNLVLTRYCMGWINPLFKNSELQAETIQSVRRNRKFMLAMYYVYMVYWHLGDDFLVGNVIENILSPMQMRNLYKEALDGKTKDEVLLMTANSILKPMLKLLSVHYGPSHKPRLYLNFSKEKPPIDQEFDKFMKKLAND